MKFVKKRGSRIYDWVRIATRMRILSGDLLFLMDVAEQKRARELNGTKNRKLGTKWKIRVRKREIGARCDQQTTTNINQRAK